MVLMAASLPRTERQWREESRTSRVLQEEDYGTVLLAFVGGSPKPARVPWTGSRWVWWQGIPYTTITDRGNLRARAGIIR
jgi:hypothetical protein